MKEKLKKAHQ